MGKVNDTFSWGKGVRGGGVRNVPPSLKISGYIIFSIGKLMGLDVDLL